MKFSVKQLTRAAIIAAIYITLTLVFAPISFGMNGFFQIRVSEMLCVLPALMPEAIPALTIGCALANLLCGATMIDILLGTLATLIGAILTYRARKNTLFASFMPVITNTLIVGPMVYFCYIMGEGAFSAKLLALSCLGVCAGEIVSCVALGNILLKILKKITMFK